MLERDAAGRVITERGPGVTRRLAYDDRGRVVTVEKEVPGAPVETTAYTYEGDRLVQMRSSHLEGFHRDFRYDCAAQ